MLGGTFPSLRHESCSSQRLFFIKALFLLLPRKNAVSERVFKSMSVPSEQPIPRPHALVLPAAKARAKRLARAEEARLPERLREVSPNVSAFAPYEELA